MKERKGFSMRMDAGIYDRLHDYCEKTRCKEVNVIENAVLSAPDYASRKEDGKKPEEKRVFSTKIDAVIAGKAKKTAAACGITMTEYIQHVLEWYMSHDRKG